MHQLCVCLIRLHTNFQEKGAALSYLKEMNFIYIQARCARHQHASCLHVYRWRDHFELFLKKVLWDAQEINDVSRLVWVGFKIFESEWFLSECILKCYVCCRMSSSGVI